MFALHWNSFVSSWQRLLFYSSGHQPLKVQFFFFKAWHPLDPICAFSKCCWLRLDTCFLQFKWLFPFWIIHFVWIKRGQPIRVRSWIDPTFLIILHQLKTVVPRSVSFRIWTTSGGTRCWFVLHDTTFCKWERHRCEFLPIIDPLHRQCTRIYCLR
jgi:hypothetical protein